MTDTTTPEVTQKTVVVDIPVVTSTWGSIKAFFKYSETIVLARFTALFGFVTAAVGSMDLSPLLSVDWKTGFSNTQVMALGGIAFAMGIIAEVARRHNDPVLASV